MLRKTPDAQTFSWQMRVLAEHFNVIPLTEAIKYLQSGKLPTRAACITFDDGYADNAVIALPILKQWGLTATFFVTTGFLDGGIMWNDAIIEIVRKVPGTILDLRKIGLNRHVIRSIEDRYETALSLISMLKYTAQEARNDQLRAIGDITGIKMPRGQMMNNTHVRELRNAGMDVGAHTVSHPILTALDDKQARREIAEGKEHLSEIIREPVRLFAYPNGKPGEDYDARHVSMVRDLGYSGAVSTVWGAARRTSDLYQLPRFTPWDKTANRFGIRLLQNCLRH